MSISGGISFAIMCGASRAWDSTWKFANSPRQDNHPGEIFGGVSGRFSCMRSKRKSLLHKAPADFSTAAGENSGADGANSRQNQGVSVVPTGAPVSLLSSHTPLPESLGLGHCRQTM